MMRLSGSVVLVSVEWRRSLARSSRRLRFSPAHGLAGLPLVLLASSHFGLVDRLALVLLRIEPGLGGQQTLEAGAGLCEVLGDVGVGGLAHAPVLLLVGGACFGDDPLRLLPDPVLGAVGPGRGAGLDPGGVEGHHPHLDQSHLRSQAQHLIEQVGEFLLVVLGEPGDRGVVGRLVR
jgi:hypothetical protein